MLGFSLALYAIADAMKVSSIAIGQAVSLVSLSNVATPVAIIIIIHFGSLAWHQECTAANSEAYSEYTTWY